MQKEYFNMGKESLTLTYTGLPSAHLQPHPRPLSEWRGEWVLLFANEGGVSLMQGEALLDIRKRPSAIEKGVSFNSRIWLPLFPLTILSHPTNSIHAPLHSERGRGWGCSWGRGRLLVEFHMGVSFCVFPCSFRNSVYLSGSVPFVHSVLKMP